MKKRGQVTTFIIIGIVALAAILLVFFLRGKIIDAVVSAEGISNYLEGQMEAITDEVERCVEDESSKSLELLGEQGGFFEPLYYLSYYGNKISFLCMDIPEDPRCSNIMLTEEKIEEQLNEKLKIDLEKCINLDGFNIAKRYDYELIFDLGSLNVVSEVNMKNVLFNVSFPVSVKRDELEINKNEFISSVDVPMGEVLSMVNGIINSETFAGNFVLNTYDLSKKPLYVLRRQYVGTNKLYLTKVIEGGYVFNFAIEDKE